MFSAFSQEVTGICAFTVFRSLRYEERTNGPILAKDTKLTSENIISNSVPHLPFTLECRKFPWTADKHIGFILILCNRTDFQRNTVLSEMIR